MGLTDKVALITGGSEGIGKAAAMAMAAEGAKVVICARRLDVLNAAANEIRTATGGDVTPLQADVSRPDEVQGLIDKVVDTYGRIDILVNNAGTSAAGYFEDITDEAWQSQDADVTLDEWYERIGRNLPLGRVGESREAGDIIAFLASERASYITGVAINIDGGTSTVV